MKKTKGIWKKIIVCVLMFALLVGIMPMKEASAKEPTITLSKSEVSLAVGKTAKLTATVSNTKEDVKWTSSNKKVATVSAAGKVTAKAEGVCYITAKVGTTSAKCKIRVFGKDILSSDFKITGETCKVNDVYYVKDGYEFLNDMSSSRTWDEYSISEASMYGAEVVDWVRTYRGISLNATKNEVIAAYGDSYTETEVTASKDGFCHVSTLYDDGDSIKIDMAKATKCVAYSYSRNSGYQIRFYFNAKSKLIAIAYVKGYSDSGYLSISSFSKY